MYTSDHYRAAAALLMRADDKHAAAAEVMLKFALAGPHTRYPNVCS